MGKLTQLDITDIRRLSINHFDTGGIICGGIPSTDASFYNKIEQQIEENGFVYITLQRRINRVMKIDTFITDKAVGVRGTVFFFYKEEEIYTYSSTDKNTTIFFDDKQTDYHFEIYIEKQSFTRDELYEMIEIVKKNNYNDLLRCFGMKDQMVQFADSMDMDDKTRTLFYICVTEKLQEQYVSRHGYPNPLLDAEIKCLEKEMSKK